MYKDLSLKEKAKVIREGVRLGLTSIDDILNLYDEAISIPEDPPVILKVNKSLADFVLRLKDPNRTYIKDWENPEYIATHKLSWAEDDKGAVIYPLVQNVNGKLIDFSRPPYDIWTGYENAIKTGDTIRMSPQEAEWFTTHYKDYYPSFDKYSKGGNIILDNNGYYTHSKDNDMLILGDSTGTNITMQGIPFKIAAWDNLGNYQELKPNGEYYFPGYMVREHALQAGGLAKPFSYGDIPDVRYLNGGNTLNYLNIPDYNVALYNTVSPLGNFPNFWEALAYKKLVKDKLKKGNIHERDYPIGKTQGEKTAMAAWAKRLGIPYDELDLPVYNGDTVTLPYSLVLEIPYDTNVLKNRIQLNKALLDKYSKYRYSDVINAAIKADLYNLDKLRETYKTGKPVGLTEFGWNSRQLVNNGEIVPIEDIYSPLNVLGNYNVRYDKPTNRLYYSDEYDFNQFENFVPGEPFRIRGYIDLNNKALGGNLFKKGGIHIKPENRGKFTALKKRTGHSASWFKAHGTPALRKMAVFELNSRHWNHKHDNGGYLYSEGGFLLAPYLYIE